MILLFCLLVQLVVGALSTVPTARGEAPSAEGMSPFSTKEPPSPSQPLVAPSEPGRSGRTPLTPKIPAIPGFAPNIAPISAPNSGSGGKAPTSSVPISVPNSPPSTPIVSPISVPNSPPTPIVPPISVPLSGPILPPAPVPVMPPRQPRNMCEISRNTLCALSRRAPGRVSCPATTNFIPGVFSSPSITFCNATSCADGICSIHLQSLTAGPIPTELAQEKYLQDLRLRSSQLNGLIPTWIGSLSYLTNLDLFNNKFTGTIPTQLTKLSELSLDLSNNLLSGTIPTFRLGTILDLSGNNLIGTVPVLQGTKTTSIYLRGNQLSSVNSAGNWSLPNLVNLELSYNQLSGSFPAVLLNNQHYPKLKVLAASHNLFTAIETINGTLQPAALIEFDLSANLLNTELPSFSFAGCPNGVVATTPDRNLFFQENRLKSKLYDLYCYRWAFVTIDPQDVDECSDGTHACEDFCENGWLPVLNYTCGCNPGRYLTDGRNCESCVNDWISLPRPENKNKFPSLASFINELEDQPFMSCSECNDGRRTKRRNVNGAEGCGSLPSVEEESCSFACSNLTYATSAGNAIESLLTEFSRDNFLNGILDRLFGVQVTFQVNQTQKRADPTQYQLALSFSPCSPRNISKIYGLITNLTYDILPQYNGQTLMTAEGCMMSLITVDQGNSNQVTLMLAISIPVGLTVVVLVIVFLWRHYFSDELDLLPAPVAESYRAWKRERLSWDYQGNSKSGFYFKELGSSSAQFQKVLTFWKAHLHGKDDMKIVSITSVYNPLLVSNFVGAYVIQNERLATSRGTFYRQTWEEQQNPLQQRVHTHYQKFSKQFQWNNEKKAPIIPVVHATDKTIAFAICETGFAAISSLDAGWFGQGIYFTTCSDYAIPYMSSKRVPALIFSWVIPGNVYPVTEDITDPDTLMGKSVKSGYTSHYVLTDKTGHVQKNMGAPELYDELVVSQEALIAPAFVIEFEVSSLVKRQLRNAPSRISLDSQSIESLAL